MDLPYTPYPDSPLFKVLFYLSFCLFYTHLFLKHVRVNCWYDAPFLLNTSLCMSSCQIGSVYLLFIFLFNQLPFYSKEELSCIYVCMYMYVSTGSWIFILLKGYNPLLLLLILMFKLAKIWLVGNPLQLSFVSFRYGLIILSFFE